MQASTKQYLSLQAWMHLRYGKTREAITVLEGLSVLTPGDNWVHRTLSYAYLQDENFSAALEHLNRCLQTQNSKTDRLMRVRALWGLGQRDEARKQLAIMGGRLRE